MTLEKQRAPIPPAIDVARPNHLAVWGGVMLLMLAVLLAWSNSFHGPFVLDDLPAIAENASIRTWRTAFNPPNDGQTVTGRPLVNLSFALNHALAGPDPLAKDPLSGKDGDQVFGYHALNLAIHLGAALVLFGLVRRTLAGPVLRAQWADLATPLAFAIALLWAVHPLQTGAVTYIAQRAESLCALLYLLTLWCLARGAESARPWRWLALGVAACLCGMASKEVMVSAPLLALLYDRTFLTGSFKAALKRRWLFYLALAMTWELLVALVLHSGNRGQTAGFNLGSDPDLTSWHYLLRQCEGIVQYLRLSAWPRPLISDYGFDVVKDPAQVWPQGLLLLALFAATLWALWRRPAWGFLGVWFFAILAPSSSFIPVGTETAAEHRMYLPLAAVMAAVVLGAQALARRLGRAGLATLAGMGMVAAVALGAVTHQRNETYQSLLALWRDVVAKRPQNARAHQELALALYKAGQAEASLPESQAALRLQPNYPTALNNYATALLALNRLPEAATVFAEAVRQKPDLAEAHLGLGNALANQGRLAEAIPHFATAAQLKPAMLIARTNLAKALGATGQTAEAVAQFQALLREQPGYFEAHFNYGNLLNSLGRLPEAVAEFSAAVQLQPADANAQLYLGVALYNSGRKAEALPHLETGVRLAPGNNEGRAILDAVHRELQR